MALCITGTGPHLSPETITFSHEPRTKFRGMIVHTLKLCLQTAETVTLILTTTIQHISCLVIQNRLHPIEQCF